MIRPAQMTDYRAILDLLEPEMTRYPIRADKDRIRKVLETVISSSRHFSMIGEQDGQLKAVLLGITNDNLWAQRMNCNIVAWISKIPGDGERLLREFTRWVSSRNGIKVSGMCPDVNDIDPRAWKLAGRFGFEQYGGSLLRYQ